MAIRAILTRESHLRGYIRGWDEWGMAVNGEPHQSVCGQQKVKQRHAWRARSPTQNGPKFGAGRLKLVSSSSVLKGSSCKLHLPASHTEASQGMLGRLWLRHENGGPTLHQALQDGDLLLEHVR